MNLVSDTSVVMAVILNEPVRQRLQSETAGANLIAPASLHWEIGNALSAGLKRGRLDTSSALRAFEEYLHHVPIQFVDVDLAAAVKMASELGIYAYDAYMITCAQENRCPLLTLDGGQRDAAAKAGVEIHYVKP